MLTDLLEAPTWPKTYGIDAHQQVRRPRQPEVDVARAGTPIMHQEKPAEK